MTQSERRLFLIKYLFEEREACRASLPPMNEAEQKRVLRSLLNIREPKEPNAEFLRVQDAGWDAAAERYTAFLRARRGQKLLFLELGVGFNTPSIIKYPFLRMTAESENAVYACLNLGQAVTARELEKRSICINADIAKTLEALLDNR